MEDEIPRYTLVLHGRVWASEYRPALRLYPALRRLSKVITERHGESWKYEDGRRAGVNNKEVSEERNLEGGKAGRTPEGA